MTAIQNVAEFAGCSTIMPMAYTDEESHTSCPPESHMSLQVQAFSDHASKSTPGAPTI